MPALPSDLDQARRTSMAAERTWLAWWRASLAASAGALAVGRLAPELLHVAPWPYVLLGCGYASLAIGLLIVGAQRQRNLEHALRSGGHVPLHFRTVGLFTAGGVALEEVHAGTLESRRCPGLYLVGEMLDVDGRIGGFNFQWAWSGAHVAGRALAAEVAFS